MEWQSSSGGAAEQTEAKRGRKILLGRWLGPVLPEGGADLKIGGYYSLRSTSRGKERREAGTIRETKP